MESSPSAGDLCRPPPSPHHGPSPPAAVQIFSSLVAVAVRRPRHGGAGPGGRRAGRAPAAGSALQPAGQHANCLLVWGRAGLGWAGLGWAGAAPGPGTRHQLQSGSRRQGASTERRLETVSPSDQCPPLTWHHRCSEQDNQ